MAGTVARREGATMAAVDLDNYPALSEGVGGLAQVMEDNVGRSLQLADLTRISVPTGGGQSFEVFDDLIRETENVKYIEGVLVHWRRARSYWPAPEPGQPEITHSPPTCSSVDGRCPVPGGEFADGGEQAHRNVPIMVSGAVQRTCRDCPMNEWGSHPKEGRKGKACKEQILLFVLQPGETLPVIISVPPSSKKVVEDFMVKLSVRYSAHHSGFALRFGLTKIEKAGSEPFSQVVPTLAGVLEGIVRGSEPDPSTPAGVSRQYAREFAELLTVEDLIEAAAGRAAGNGHANGVMNGEVVSEGDLGGEFAEYEMEPTGS